MFRVVDLGLFLRSYFCVGLNVGKRALRVAARWTVQRILETGQPSIAPEVIAWVESERSFTARADYLQDLTRLDLIRDNTFENLQTAEEEMFADAKDSVGAMLPKVLQTLGKKFREKFYMRATQQRFKLYYYFAGHPALETIALTLTLKGGKPLLWLGYIPQKISGGSDIAKSKQEQVAVHDPEMAGLALMRLLRKLMDRVD